MLKISKNWKEDEQGATLVFAGVSLAVLLGFAALTFDLGRVASTQSDMQAFADHVALAAAGELDGKNDSITRAIAAAEQLIQGRQTFADGAQALDNADYTIRFMEDLPATDRFYREPNNDLTYLDTSDAKSAALAAFVEVETVQRSIFMPFFNAMSAISGDQGRNGTARARAVAGSQEWACDVPTLLFCLPTDVTLFEGQGIRMRSSGNESSWKPGNFGFVDPAQFAADPNGPCNGLNGSNLYACLVAASGNRTTCIPQNGINVRPGQGVGITNAAFNTRFDMFNGVMSNEKNNRAYAPGPHVVSGLTSNGNGQCLSNNTSPSPDTMAFPADDCFGSGLPCPYGEGRFGDGNWSNGRVDYVATNYGLAISDDPHAFDHASPSTAVRTRFEYYKSEIAKANGGAILNGRSEDGLSQCSNPNFRSDDINRRVFIAAGIDCSGVDFSGNATNVSVEKYYEVFLLQPVGGGNGNTSGFDLFVEVIGEAGGNGSGNSSELSIFRNVVELYR